MSPSGYTLAADAVVVFHALFILFAVAGGLLSRWWPWAAACHLPAVAWAAWIELSGGVCPLTPLENSLRQLGGASPYPGAFVEHYLLPLIYPPGLTPAVQLTLAGAVIGINVVVYAWAIRRWRR